MGGKKCRQSAELFPKKGAFYCLYMGYDTKMSLTLIEKVLIAAQNNESACSSGSTI